jgi:hypothetical protein
MKRKNTSPKLVVMLSAFFMMACLLPGMIPLKSAPEGPMPIMETDADQVMKVLSGENWQYLQALAQETYTDEDYAKPGTLTYTVNITDETPVYFNYGWCAVDEQTLKQNFEHIDVKLYLNEEELGKDVVQNLNYTSQDNLLCLDYGVLTSNWPEGKYKLKAVATFDEKINDGMADYEPGDYIFEYNVTVTKQREGAFMPSRISLQIGI